MKTTCDETNKPGCGVIYVAVGERCVKETEESLASLRATNPALPAKVRRVAGHFAGIGPHEENRFTGCWEKLAIASLGIDEATLAVCATHPGTDALRKSVAKGAFHSFRVLPHDVLPELQQRILGLWREAPELNPADLGGRGFQIFASILGPVGAAKLMRRFTRPSYARCKTLENKQAFEALFALLPACKL